MTVGHITLYDPDGVEIASGQAEFYLAEIWRLKGALHFTPTISSVGASVRLQYLDAHGTHRSRTMPIERMKFRAHDRCSITVTVNFEL